MVLPVGPGGLLQSLVSLVYECQEAADAIKRVQKDDVKDLHNTIQSLRGPLEAYNSRAAAGELSADMIGPLSSLARHLKEARNLLKKFDKMSVAYRFVCHRKIAADSRNIKDAIRSDISFFNFAGRLPQERMARETSNQVRELRDMFERFLADSGSNASESSCFSPGRSETSMVDGLNFEERAHERSVIPAEISALQEAGERESADSLARVLDRLESFRDNPSSQSIPFKDMQSSDLQQKHSTMKVTEAVVTCEEREQLSVDGERMNGAESSGFRLLEASTWLGGNAHQSSQEPITSDFGSEGGGPTGPVVRIEDKGCQAEGALYWLSGDRWEGGKSCQRLESRETAGSSNVGTTGGLRGRSAGASGRSESQNCETVLGSYQRERPKPPMVETQIPSRNSEIERWLGGAL